MKRVLSGMAIVVAAALLVVVALPFLIDANQFRPRLEAELSQRLGRDVKLGNLKLSVLSGGVGASDISIAEDPKFGHTPFLTAQSLSVGVSLGGLIFSRRLDVTGVTIDKPGVSLLQDSTGAWNFSSLGTKPSGQPQPAAAPQGGAGGSSNLNLSVKLVKIADGRLVLSQTAGSAPPEVLSNVNLEIRDLSATAAFPFSLSASATGGAQFKLDGTAGPLNPANTAATPFSASLQVTHLDLAHSGFLPAAAFAGLVSIAGKVHSNGQAATVQGTVQAERLVLAKGGSPAQKPVVLAFELEQDLVRHAGSLQRGDIRIGAAAASLTGSYHSEGESTVVDFRLLAPGMAIPELEAMLPALNIALPAGSSLQGGTAKIDMTATGPTDHVVLDGSAGLNNTRLAGFNLGAKMALVTKLAGMKNGSDTEIQSLSSHLHADAQGLRADNISLIAPQMGELSGSGTVSASHALDFKMTAKMHAGGVLAAVGSNTSVPFRIAGTSENPKFEPDVKGIVENKLKSLEGAPGGKAAQGILKGLLRSKKN
ncbi:MAG TPA: AsmA family protein [Bryobacteraceae bacterium]|nr:AsmA family protein [Bryobacteraceae bacterium]